MFRAVFPVAAALITFGIAPLFAAADDRKTCDDWRYPEEAYAACSRLISQEPNVADHYYKRGSAYYRRDPDHGIADFDQAIRLNPKDFFSYVQRGDSYRLKRDYDRAIADYDKAIEIVGFKGDSPKSFRGGLSHDDSLHYAYSGRGHAYKDKGDYDRAMADYDKAIRLNPYDSEYFDRGVAYLEGKHDYDRAIADFDQAIRIERVQHRVLLFAAYDGRGLAYSGKGDYNRAIGDFDQAVQRNPNYANAYSHRGYAYGKKGDFDRAMADLDKALSLDPKYARGYANRAAILELHGDLARAIADYDQAIALDPNDATARAGRERAQALLTPNRPGAAPAQAHLAPQASPPQPVTSAIPAPPPGVGEERPNANHLQPVTPAISAPAQAQLPPQTSPPQPAISTVPAERRVALVIGNSGYTSSLVQALPNPRRDAKLVADALRQAGFEVMELVDLDRNGMATALQAFRAKAASADWALVYFAGHGIEINRVNYLIPVDAKLADSGDIELETVSYEAVLNAIGGAKALRIIILDACRNNPFKAQMHQTMALRGSLDRGLAAPPETKPGTLVVYSAKEGQAAVDGDGFNSPFALAFAARLKKPGREVQRMFDDVRDDVLQATSERQEPYKYGSLPGSRDFFFVAEK